MPDAIDSKLTKLAYEKLMSIARRQELMYGKAQIIFELEFNDKSGEPVFLNVEEKFRHSALLKK